MTAVKKSGIVLAAAAAALFVAGNVATVSTAEAGVKCVGANACKGQSACKTANSSCKGQNACKGQGFIQAENKSSCEAKGGKVG